MAMADFVYPISAQKIVTGDIDLDAVTLAVLLVNNTYTPNAAHNFRDDITGEVAASGGYATGGSDLTGVTVTISGTKVLLSADDVSWAGVTTTAYGAIVYVNRGGAASADELLCALLFSNAPVSSTAGDFDVAFDSGVILEIETAQ